MVQRLRNWWSADIYRRYLMLFGLAYAWFFGQGIPLWDDDFTSWFWKIQDRSIFQTLIEIVSPISTQPQFWGFNERPIQALVYQFFYLISGYESWSYMLFKSCVYSGLGVMIYMWGKRLVPETRQGALAAVAASVFFLLTPGPMAAHVIHSDLAPLAELFFLISTYFIWSEVERTPAEWTGVPKWSDPEQEKWIIRWAIISFLTYVAYKSKADLKLVPAILAAYIFVVRRKQWRLFAFPIGLMVLLAVPWGGAIFHKLPPFIPGSKGSEIGWMWQPASGSRLMEFLWASAPYQFFGSLRSPTLSLSAMLGPFLIVPLLGFLLWRMEAIDKVPWLRLTTRADRARTFVLIWCAAILVGISALPEINYIFRIRYGILPLVPVSLMLAWALGLFAESLDRLPKWALAAAVAVFTVQAGINLNRSISFRRDLGQVMVAVDQVYEHFAQNYSDGSNKLTLLPDFRPYDYRPKGPKAVLDKEWLSDAQDLPNKKYLPEKTYVVSWKPSLWQELEMVEHFPGCRTTSLFDRVFPCPAGSGTYLMRYIGNDPLYQQAEALRNKGDVPGARKLHEEFLAKHPNSLAGQFVMGLLAYQQKDWPRAQAVYAKLETYLPDHLSILYNYALVLGELSLYKGGIDRLKFIAQREPQNYPVWINLYWMYKKDKQEQGAKDTLTAMKKNFPADAEVNRLLASGA